MILNVLRAGLLSYQNALLFQRKLMQMRQHQLVDDTVIMLEHPPTVTLGKYCQQDNLLISHQELSQKGIALANSDRGGDVSYHCPGQLVCYFICNLNTMGTNVRRFISDLEQVLRLTLENFNISADASFHHPGIWIEGRQISAIGLRVSHGVTMHGISLNVNNDLEYSKWINICGISGAEATSLKQLLKQPVSVSDVSPVFLGSISRVFQAKFKPVTNLDDIGISVDVQAA